jgi:hypothetical protein
VTIPKTNFLSTESVPGTFEISNPTATTLNYWPVSTTFVVRNADGTTYERRLITVITRPVPQIPIAPGGHLSETYVLPICEVEADPCVEHVQLKTQLLAPNGCTLTTASQEVFFTLVADPSATFLANGLDQNVPAILVQGEASTVLPLRDLRITFQVPQAAVSSGGTIPEQSEIDAIFKQHVGNHGMGTLEHGGSEYVVVLEDDRTLDASTSAAIADVQQQLGTRAQLVSTVYAGSYRDIFQFVGKARDAASERAQQLADFIGAGKIDNFELHVFDGVRQIEVARPGVPMQQEVGFIPLGELAFDSSTLTADVNAGKAFLDIRARDTTAFFASPTPALNVPSVSKEIALSYLSSSDDGRPTLPLRLTIAADRPQIFSVAQTTREVSAPFGFDATFAAAALAADRDRALARELGVNAGSPTLVAAYPTPMASDTARVVASGVALGAIGNLDAAWQNSVRDSAGRKPKPLQTPEGPLGPIPFFTTQNQRVRAQPTPAAFQIPIQLSRSDRQFVVTADVGSVATSAAQSCESLVREAQRRSLERDLGEAVSLAGEAGKVLRHLVLVAAYPPYVDPRNPCAHGPGSATQTFATLDVDARTIHAPVELTFRTQ